MIRLAVAFDLDNTLADRSRRSPVRWRGCWIACWRSSYRKWTAQQKLEIVLAGLRGDRSVREVCREHAISETLFYGWRDQLLEAGKERFAGKEERQGEWELRRKVAELERALGRKTYELELAGKLWREWN
jgi:transposase